MLELRVAKPTELRDAIAAVLWDRPMIPTTVECAVCSQKIQTDTYFRKFAYRESLRSSNRDPAIISISCCQNWATLSSSYASCPCLWVAFVVIAT